MSSTSPQTGHSTCHAPSVKVFHYRHRIWHQPPHEVLHLLEHVDLHITVQIDYVLSSFRWEAPALSSQTAQIGWYADLAIILHSSVYGHISLSSTSRAWISICSTHSSSVGGSTCQTNFSFDVLFACRSSQTFNIWFVGLSSLPSNLNPSFVYTNGSLKTEIFCPSQTLHKPFRIRTSPCCKYLSKPRSLDPPFLVVMKSLRG